MTEALSFRDYGLIEGPGLLVGCDEKQEWMLPWWWENYSAHNHFPVTFVDFGLSEEARLWCKEKGELVTLVLPNCFSFSSALIPSSIKQKWEKVFEWGETSEDSIWWYKRMRCHQKPFAFLLSPYKSTLWVDVDCEILGSLESLFAEMQKKEKIFVAPNSQETQEFDAESKLGLPGELSLNSGVVGFTRGSEQILRWAQDTITEHPYFLSDENILARLVFTEGWDIEKLDPIYNWAPHFRGVNPQAKIHHWIGNSGKFFISLKAQKIF